MRFKGKLFRALNPLFAREPLSGHGARLYGGRFNAKGTPALNTSTSVATALREANQVGDLQPTTLVCYDADIECVFDTRNEMALKRFGIDAKDLADPAWRDRMTTSSAAPSQQFAARLMAQGFDALLVRSFAAGATDDDLNLVLWRWGSGPPASLVLIDEEGRLTPAS